MPKICSIVFLRRSASWISRLIRRSSPPRFTSADGVREAYRHAGILVPDPFDVPTPDVTAKRLKADANTGSASATAISATRPACPNDPCVQKNFRPSPCRNSW